MSGAAGLSGAAGAPAPPPLEVAGPAGAAACDPAICTVAHDWDALETNIHTFDAFRIATSADTTYLTLETYDGQGYRRRFIALDDQGNVEVDQGSIAQTSAPFLAVDADGSPHVLGYALQPIGSGMRAPLVESVFHESTWSSSTIPNAIVVDGFEVDPSGRSLAYVETDAQEIALATREQGSWTQALLPENDQRGSLALDVNGKPIFYGAGAELLSVYDLAGTLIFSQPVPTGITSGVAGYVTFAAAQPQRISGISADLALALLLPDGLHVLQFDRASGEPSPGPLDVLIPDSAAPAIGCPPPEIGASNQSQLGAECAPTCTFTGSGLAPAGAFSLVRTGDGTLFLAYLVSDYDLTYSYTWHSGPTALSCITDGAAGTWTSTLHVVRVAPDGGALAEAMTVPLGKSNGARIVPTNDTWAVAARSFGQRVVVGVAERPGSGLAGVRVTAFDAVH